jgi:type IV pilus assembly protein PilM
MNQRQDATLTAKTQGVSCGQCKQHNSSDSRFCSGCGSSLWESCLSCGAECNTGETFCGSCGANLRESVASQIEAAEAALAKASELESQHQLDDAIRVVRAVRLSDDSRLKQISQRVSTQLQHLREQRSRDARHLEAGMKKIRGMLDANAYADVRQMLEKLPTRYRSEESERLLAEATSKQQELSDLKAEIRAAVKKKQITKLAPTIQRVLTLQPDAAPILRLSEQIRDRLLLASNRKLMAFDYRQAQDILAQIPGCAIDDNTKRLGKQIAEFLWLEDDLLRSPIIDKPLRDIARRFATKVPGDEKNAEHCNRLLRIASKNEASGSKRFPAITWAKPPKQTHVGCHVEWLGGSERLAFSDSTIESNWNSEPGRFFVAAGLALQGVDICELPTNLLEVQRQGMLGSFAIGRRKETTKRAWGIDIGDSSLKVLRLVMSSESATPTIDCCEVIPYRTLLSRPEAKDQRHSILAESLGEFLSQHTVDKSDRVCISISGAKVLARSMELPNASQNKLTEMIEYEAKQNLPIPLSELAWSYHRFAGDTESDSSNRLPNTLLIAAKQKDVQELKRLCEEFELPLHILQSEAAALFNFVRFEGLGEWASEQSSEPTPIAILDIGAASTNLVIDHGGRPWFRTFGRGGDDFTNAVAQQLNLTREQAEQVKIEPTLARRLNELDEAYSSKLMQLTNEVRRSLDLFAKESGSDVTHLLGTGGGFRLHGLFKYFRNGP